jgi:hypothetical protein
MHRFSASIASAVISVSLISSPTAAHAATPVAATSGVNPWAVLAVMSGGAPAAAACGAASLAAAQTQGGCVLPQMDVQPPVAQTTPVAPTMPVMPYQGGIPTPPIPVLAIWAAVLGVMVYIATKNDNRLLIPNSPV